MQTRALAEGGWVEAGNPSDDLRSGVDREPARQIVGALLGASFRRGVALFAVLGQPIENLHDQLADTPELRDAEAARRAGWRAETDAGGDHRLLRIERHAVLVAGDMGAPERRLGRLAGQLLRPEIDQHKVVVGAARDDGVTGGRDR